MYVRPISTRFSRGRSTPASRAMWANSLCMRRSVALPSPTAQSGPRPPTGGAAVRTAVGRARRRLALALLVAQVVADDHDPAVPADHLALVADLLDARLDLHDVFLV